MTGRSEEQLEFLAQLYERGGDQSLDRSPLATGCSSALHESQSRLWENVVGRSLPFWRWYYPQFRDGFASVLAGVSLERFGNAVLYGRNPVSPDAQADYFDSLYHSHAVVGLVTSAFLEAAIVGRPVYTPLLPEFEMYQEGVQHFRYLVEVEGGLLKVNRSLPEHLAELASALARPVERDEQNARFIRAFVRPRGLDVPATPAFVAAIEELGAAP